MTKFDPLKVRSTQSVCCADFTIEFTKNNRSADITHNVTSFRQRIHGTRTHCNASWRQFTVRITDPGRISPISPVRFCDPDELRQPCWPDNENTMWRLANVQKSTRNSSRAQKKTGEIPRFSSLPSNYFTISMISRMPIGELISMVRETQSEWSCMANLK